MQIKDASRTPTLLGIDAKAFAFILPSIFYISVKTVSFDLCVIVFFIVLRIKKIGPGVAYLRLRSRIRGKVTSARPWWFLKKWRVR